MKINCHRAAGNRGQGTAGPAIDSRRAAGAPSRRGIALVITLIMLSVTLVMAIAFLALARRERNAVSTTTDTTRAKLAADSALAAAQAQIMANILNTNSALTPSNALYNFGLLISTNFINTNGFVQNLANPTNVNYDHLFLSGTPLAAADFVQNVANLQYLPRVPVFVQTNAAGSNDFRFYLDLNRNGQFDSTTYVDNSVTNGPLSEMGDPQWIGILERPDTTHSVDNQFLSRYAFIAVPIGNGLDINAIHNQALAANNSDLNLAQDDYFRNEGVGSWELNLAAFLADLNTDEWDPVTGFYEYNRANNAPSPNLGFAFEDAFSILTNRYAGNYNTLTLPGTAIIPPANISSYDALTQVGIDGYTYGPLLTGTALPYFLTGPASSKPWVGSVNTNHFYDLPSDLFNPSETSADFVNRLTTAGDSIATNYDRYTYYRLLAQMGTDSDPDDGKMNLNFRNITNGVVVPNMETNLYPWTALDFFTNAADRMLRLYSTNWFAANPSNFLAAYYNLTLTNINSHYKSYYYSNAFGFNVAYDPSGFGLTNISSSAFLGWTNAVPAFSITNIPVYVNGQFVYSPAINRILQLAANIYDSSTTNFYPSVFRPIFEHDRLGNVFIVGYTNLAAKIGGITVPNVVNGSNDPQLSTPYNIASLTNWAGLIPGSFSPMNTNVSGALVSINAYGVPWIIGAKKGFPNFNKFGMQTVVQAVRRLQITRSTIPTTLGTTTFQTNQLLTFAINNTLNADCWNSYSNSYNNPVNIYALDTLSMEITNNINPTPTSFFNFQIFSNTFVPRWPGYTNNGNVALSFTNPLSATATLLLTNSGFYFGTTPPGITGFSTGWAGWESNNFSLQFPQLGLMATNQLQLYMLDDSSASSGSYHVIDYVQFGGPQTALDLTEAIETNNPSAVGYGSNMWSQSLNGTVPYGILSQMDASLLPITGNGGPGYWANNAANQAMIEGLNAFMGLTGPYPSAYQNSPGIMQIFTTNYVVQAAYTPIVTISEYTSWQANDPLVHYLASDLTFNGVEKTTGVQTGTQITYASIGSPANLLAPVFNVPNDRYQPWGMGLTNLPQIGLNAVVPNTYALAVKDPLVWQSDYWEFPTNLYPTVGWLGRVHRGTPWQTVYLKAHDVLNVLATNNGVGSVGSGTNTWSNWTGDNNIVDLAHSVPVQDRLLFDLFTTRPNDNAALGTLSVNQTNLAAWSAVFSGMVALTNVTSYPNSAFPAGVKLTSSNSWVIIPPAGVNGYNSAFGTLVTNINFARYGTNLTYGFTNADGVVGSYEHAGDILANPVLTEHSPFLNLGNASLQNQQANLLKFGISDAAYEWLPQQMMGLVRETRDPRYVIYCYGQALRPAPNGLVTSASNFGLVTNYQVVAESVVRAVVSVHAQVNMSGSYPVTNYTTRVESYNVLPPE
jgi:hypothetical protein